ncbi:MAG: hypothetical protein J6B85_03705 [Lachnospiraceae bacterium]|nr:hypothetical protein [Lachnospiraceae bacterium]
MGETKYQKKDNSIITVDEIKSILSDYRIGKKPLAKLLGWGETTIIRYIEGDIPTNAYSDKLRALMDDPNYYYEILLANKDNLTGVAFKKSKKATLSKIMESKICVVAQYIVNKANAEISPGRVQSMLYYSQAFFLALHNRELFDEDYQITYNNMPYLKLYDNMRNRGVSVLELNDDSLNKNEKEIVDAVYDAFEWYGPRALRTLSNYEKNAMRVSRDKENSKVITKDVIRSYFREICALYQVNHPEEIREYPDRKLAELKN